MKADLLNTARNSIISIFGSKRSNADSGGKNDGISPCHFLSNLKKKCNSKEYWFYTILLHSFPCRRSVESRRGIPRLHIPISLLWTTTLGHTDKETGNGSVDVETWRGGTRQGKWREKYRLWRMSWYLQALIASRLSTSMALRASQSTLQNDLTVEFCKNKE